MFEVEVVVGEVGVAVFQEVFDGLLGVGSVSVGNVDEVYCEAVAVGDSSEGVECENVRLVEVAEEGGFGDVAEVVYGSLRGD